MKLHLALLARLALLSGCAAVAAAAAQSNITCSSGLFMIVARGSSEAPGTGRIGVVAGNVSELIPNSAIVALDYPATFSAYVDSEGLGTAAMTAWIKAYVAACPDGKISLIGYSQGGQVTADTLCGTYDGQYFARTPDLADTYEQNIVAAIMFGDPSHNVSASWNAGTSTQNGLFPRQNLSACDPYSSKMRSWCDTGDRYCAGGNNTLTHGTYFANYTMDAVNFIVQKYNESLSAEPTATSSASASATVSSTASPSSVSGSSASFLTAPAAPWQHLFWLLFMYLAIS
ncbi:Cutinase-domain-containing protein [Pleurostoma richardsiae]|uniref:Cutinase-domain-containing protein n=1 Tax=Pleurostoma richardsiae TaxID=41990 RepID=A0AA38RGV2_9PEZI|nr:Cutinase-domain-containing protein [Pleurostoma richardsiae]